jgi:hypothetical protein
MGWIKFVDFATDRALFSTGDSGTTDRYLHLIARNAKAHMGFHGDDLAGITTLQTDTWYNLAFVWEGSSTKKRYIYIDGNLDNQGVSSGLLTVTSGTLTGNGGWIGRYGSVFHYGYIANLLIYNRALSQSEIQYNINNPITPISSGLILFLIANPETIQDIDNDGINEWIDLSGNNNHGKIYNATLQQDSTSPIPGILPVKRLLSPSRTQSPTR